MANNYILNQEVFNKAVEEYRKELPNTRKGEIFKWQAVKHFQNNWDIDAKDFPTMLDKSLEKTSSLLAANMFFPRKMIWELAQFQTSQVREMFRDLFNENIGLLERCESFEQKANELLSQYKPGKNSYQNFNTISIYLWLRFPDKYYVYKSGIYRDVASKLFNLTIADLPKGNKKRYEEIIQCFELYKILSDALRNDSSLIEDSNKYLSNDCYADNNHHILTVDFVFFMAQLEKKSGAKTYLFSWNPEKWAWDSFDEDRSDCIQDDTVIHRWTSASHQPRIGDNFFMIRLGSEPRGIFASGTITSNAYDDKHWDASGKVAKYVDLQFDIILDPMKKNLPISTLNGLVSKITPDKKFNWSPQGSGIEIPSIYLKALTDEWSNIEDQVADIGKSEINSINHQPLNKILYGPPGTGKTYEIQRIAKDYMNDEYELVTFHQSFSYEDFVEGIRASTNDKDQIQYKIEDGVFKKICDEARKNPHKKFAIFIDEINRGNIANIFGELITLIEPDKRAGQKNELSVTLPYSQQLFSVPSNLDIYGTMNTSDHSLTKLDLALRRRFEFVELLPDYSLLDDIEVHGVNIGEMLQIMNARIEILLGRDYLIGHSYFLSLKDIENKEQILADIFKNKIIPLLQEYFFEDWERIQWVLNDKSKDPKCQFIHLLSDTTVQEYLGNKMKKLGVLFANVNDSTHIPDRRYQINKDAFKVAEAYSKILAE